MKYQHRELASGRWNELSLVEQLGHIGSEVEPVRRAELAPEVAM